MNKRQKKKLNKKFGYKKYFNYRWKIICDVLYSMVDKESQDEITSINVTHGKSANLKHPRECNLYMGCRKCVTIYPRTAINDKDFKYSPPTLFYSYF